MNGTDRTKERKDDVTGHLHSVHGYSDLLFTAELKTFSFSLDYGENET